MNNLNINYNNEKLSLPNKINTKHIKIKPNKPKTCHETQTTGEINKKHKNLH